jgi:hypothetical protein
MTTNEGKYYIWDPTSLMTFIYLPNIPAHIGPGVYSASSRNEYQKQKSKVSGE